MSLTQPLSPLNLYYNTREQKKLTEQQQERAKEAEKMAQDSAVRIASLESELKQTQSNLEEVRGQQAAKTAQRGRGGGKKRGGGRPSSRK